MLQGSHAARPALHAQHNHGHARHVTQQQVAQASAGLSCRTLCSVPLPVVTMQQHQAGLAQRSCRLPSGIWLALFTPSATHSLQLVAHPLLHFEPPNTGPQYFQTWNSLQLLHQAALWPRRTVHPKPVDQKLPCRPDLPTRPQLGTAGDKPQAGTVPGDKPGWQLGATCHVRLSQHVGHSTASEAHPLAVCGKRLAGGLPTADASHTQHSSS